MICSIAETVTVFLLLLGVMGILACLHCGSEYFLTRRHHRNTYAHEDEDKLRAESRSENGITQHSIFYKFFFRN